MSRFTSTGARSDDGGLVTGLMLLGGGILLMVLVGVALNVSQGVTRFNTAAETTLPGTVRFDAVDGFRYGVALDVIAGTEDHVLTSTACTLTQPDGSTREIRGSRSSSIIAGGITRFATIEGQGGTTTLECASTRSSRVASLIVFRPVPGLNTALYTGMGAGLLLVLLGVWQLRRPRGQSELSELRQQVREEAPEPLPPVGVGARATVRHGFAQALAGWNEAHGGAGSGTVGSTQGQTGDALDTSALPPILGVSFATFVSAEAGLRRDRVRPADTDAYLIGLGIAPGTWPEVRAGWHREMARDWRVGAAFGQAITDEGRR